MLLSLVSDGNLIGDADALEVFDKVTEINEPSDKVSLDI